MERNEDRLLSDAILMEHATNLPPQTMYKIAVRYLKVKMTQIEFWQARWREDVVRINFEILNNWRTRNDGPQARAELDKILHRAKIYITAQQIVKYVFYILISCVTLVIPVLIHKYMGECIYTVMNPGA